MTEGASDLDHVVLGAAEGGWARRRETPIEARDLGLAAASAVRIGGAELRNTGDTAYALDWHRHDNDLHFVLVLGGSFVLELAEGPVTMRAGSAAALPALLEHKEYGFSADFAGLMVTAPAAFETIPRGGELPERTGSLARGRPAVSHGFSGDLGVGDVTGGTIDIRVRRRPGLSASEWRLTTVDEVLALEIGVGA